MESKSKKSLDDDFDGDAERKPGNKKEFKQKKGEEKTGKQKKM